jgi:hypothetical protein
MCIATVSAYEFDMEAAKKTLAIRGFHSADAEWLGFIAQNHLKAYSGESVKRKLIPLILDISDQTQLADLAALLAYKQKP